ncbi:MAG TPA: thioredoxin domain-containing protein [Gaiellaceae bacterium]|nr:thioredoxin domain-containing protein [Gaiellaceae bacterium]
MNRLAAETSPYLLQHADNPVDWYAWGEEAFARAREEDKPVLLSVGYAACHWCHVMEHESFENEEIARLMNEHYVSVKVDREERPDVDGLYMDAVVAMTGAGGWPMTVFLTPDGKPFFGGTYFPPEPRRGMPSFPQVLTAVAEAYRTRRGDLERQAEALVEAIRRASEQPPSGEPLTTGLLSGALPRLRKLFDPAEGGFGPAPKFPAASTIELLLRLHARGGADDALHMATLTLDRMAAGGMYDVLGGGFHRYSVDARWLVPHFEKMLYDNALLASAYLHAWTVTGEERYRRVVEETLDYMLRELRLPEGGFASAQDADTDGVEGLTYSWTPEEIEAVLGEDRSAWLQPFEDGRFVLRGELPADARAALLRAREKRPQPLRDDKVLAGWNGLALAALAEAGALLGRADWLDAARALGEFLLEPLSGEGGRLLRTYREGEARIPAYLEDYANVANGLVELSWATGELRWLEEARRLAGLMVDLFADPERGGFYVDAPSDGNGLVARRKEFDDHPTPAGNSMAAFVLLRLARIYGDEELERRAVGVFRLALPLMERAPGAVPHLLCALDLHFSPPREVAVVGESEELRAAALSGFRPNTVFAFSPEPTKAVPLLAGKGLVAGAPAAYVCESFACQRPVTAAHELRRLLAGDAAA